MTAVYSDRSAVHRTQCGIDYLWDLSSVAVDVFVVGDGQWASRLMLAMVESCTRVLVKTCRRW